MTATAALVTVATAGTPQRLIATSTPCAKIRISARNGSSPNTGKIWLGTSTLNKASGAGVIDVLAIPSTSLQTPFIEIDGGPMGNQLDASDYYIDAGVNGEGVHFTYWTR